MSKYASAGSNISDASSSSSISTKGRKKRLVVDDSAELSATGLQPERLSPEATAKLLEAAYAAIPAKAGPRRSKMMRRIRNKRFAVQKQDDWSKWEAMKCHEKRMEKRKTRIADFKVAKQKAAEQVAIRNAFAKSRM